MKTRIEKDSVGALEIPVDAYYGVQSYRAMLNFPITGKRMPAEMIASLAEVKKASAIANHIDGGLSDDVYKAICDACDYIIAGNLHDQFICDPIQGGAGTSANMNANEVVANKALELLGQTKGDYKMVHPNDHVNLCQSTNDVYPTAGKLTALKLIDKMLPKLEHLLEALNRKAEEYKDIIKMGRTQLQDAVPVSLGGSFKAFASAIKRDIDRIKKTADGLKTINMAATAVGSCINATQGYYDNIMKCMCDVTGYDFVRSEDLYDGTQNLDTFVYVSGAIKACAVNMSKMSNDLRLMSSGPKTGLGEIVLPPRQNGSSIMPGKINPVIPEVVSQVAFNIIGNDMTITMAAEAGQLELNAFEPVLFYNLFESIETLGNAAVTLADNCIDGIVANAEVCKNYVERSAGLVTALCPVIGYVKSADIAKKIIASGKTAKEYLLEEGTFSEKEIDEMLDPVKLVYPIEF
ncbi:MAG: aspartate ammonia-lyase [Ruminococcaceae bacterium]|nr:aspartate ammonia-lyase [Oscillospiraceae bacterium]